MDNITFVPDPKTEENSYPCLRKDVASELLVLFFDQKTGVVINAGRSYTKGFYHGGWLSANDSKEWIPVHGTVSFKL
jgi:hypothetical protein